MKMCVQQWCNDADGGKPKYLQKNLPQCHPAQHKSYMDSPGIEPRPPRDRPATDRLNTAEEGHQPTKELTESHSRPVTGLLYLFTYTTEFPPSVFRITG
jgi:hypothetical protein